MDVVNIYFGENYFEKGEIICGLNFFAKVISTPKKTWYKSLFELITLGFYKAPLYYKCKIINYNNEKNC